ncbi:DUF4082 domain-containing protein [Nonomuraea sp. SBT364]|uniref:DUF4082 domain-containing protein n=1 Tax=Nonomuraea sp. SBT364 TaxID=1580530 RepID=UPI00066E9ED5|nr:DUF4082 domain-containing protein [Nonomuraea sp. SBT364]
MNGSPHPRENHRKSLGRTLTAAAAALAALAALAGPAPASPVQQRAAAQEESFWSPTSVVPVRLARDRRPVELGMRFTPSRTGSVVAVRFYKHRRAAAGHTAGLWDAAGNRLARVPFGAETASGWQEVRLPHPVTLRAGRSYVVSYHAPDGRYAVARHYFRRYLPGTESLGVTAWNGAYAYGASAFPRRTSAGHNYLVDVVFRPGAPAPGPSPTRTVTPTQSPTKSPTSSPTRSPTATPTGTSTVTASPTRTPTDRPTGTPEPTKPEPTNPGPTEPGPTEPGPSTPGRPGCELPAHPTPACTGVPDSLRLSTIKGDFTAAKPGQVLDGVHITGDLTVEASGVVIRNSRIDGLITNWKTGGSFTITDSTVGPEKGCRIYPAVGEKNFTATRIEVRGFDDGFRMSGKNVTIRDSYVNLCGPPTSHSDGIQAYCPGGIVCSGLVFDHNTIDQRNAPEHSDPVNLVDKNLSAVTVTDNMLAGGNYTLFLQWRSGPKWKVSGNKLVHDAWDFGPVSSADTCENIDWGPGNAVVTIDKSYRITRTVQHLHDCVE